MSEFDQKDQHIDGSQFNAGGNINFFAEDRRERHYRTILNWDRKTSLREFDLSQRNLEGLQLRYVDLVASNLSYANLNRTDLKGANLQQANFVGATLENAILVEANLSKSNITIEQLRLASRLRRARMPDGRIYDGRFNLESDTKKCQEEADLYFGSKSIDAISLLQVGIGMLYSPEKFVTRWYGVSKEEYLAGQNWAEENGIKRFMPVYSSIGDLIHFFIK